MHISKMLRHSCQLELRALNLVLMGVVFAFAAVAVLVLQSVAAHAVPASPELRTLTQPDGTRFEARLWGDEWVNGWETAAGYTILKDEKTSRWFYAEPADDGSLRASGRMAGKDQPPLGQAKFLRPAENISKAKRAALSVREPERLPPFTGVNNVLTVLVNYADTNTTYVPSQYQSLLFGSGNFSMADFYKEVSYGQFTVSQGPAGVLGWYKIPQTRAQVAPERLWGTPVLEAVKAADRAGVNFAPYDQDGDCYVDAVNIVHQGFGQEETGDSLDIWSHRSTLADMRVGPYVTNTPCSRGGYIKANDYVMQPERQLSGLTTVGVFAHEYGHALGLPDLYDPDYTSYGVGRWSGMGGGSWNRVDRPGDRPALFDAWSRYRLGWIKPEKITDKTPTRKTLRPANASSDAWQFHEGDAVTGRGEYFLVENRQKAGFDAGLPAAGVLVWHIDEAMGSDADNDANENECVPLTPGKCASVHYRVGLVQADGQWDLERRISVGDSGDPFPGTTNKSSFTADTNPAALLYSGARSAIRMSSIGLSGQDASASVSFGDTGPLVLRFLNVMTSGSGSVTFSPAGELSNCSGKCTNGFAEGTVVTLTASPAAGFAFSKWSGNSACTGLGTCQLTMSRNMSVRAQFKALPRYALTYSKSGKGTGTVAFSPDGLAGGGACAKSCRKTYVSGSTVTMTAAAAPGSVFMGWSGGVCTGTGSCTVSMSKRLSVKAAFAKSPAVSSCLEPGCSAASPVTVSQMVARR